MNNQKGKQLLSSVLSEIGLTIEDAKTWLADTSDAQEPAPTCGCTGCSNQFDKPPVDIFWYAPVKDVRLGSNVTVALGQSCETTQVFVGSECIVGIAKAELKYDAELDIPMLYLEIIKPRVDLNHAITI